MSLISWFRERIGAEALPFGALLREKRVPQHRHAFWYLFGGLTLFLLGLQVVTGTLLLTRFEPSAQPAVDPLSARPLAIVRATDSVVVATVTDSSLFEYKVGETIGFLVQGSIATSIPEELQGKVRVEAVIPKDSTWYTTVAPAAVVRADSGRAGGGAEVVDRPDVLPALRDHVALVRDASGGLVHPSAAYLSIKRIEQDVPFGGLLRGLHAYGAQFLIAAMFVHMFSAFLLAAYRRPRELLWVSGVLLFGIMLGFGFTGYLLPWNVLSYYATRVGVGYPENFVPGVGKWLADMLRGGAEVTGVTLSRLFALHVVVLPLAAIAVAIAHVGLLQVHGVSTPVRAVSSGRVRSALLAGVVALGVLVFGRAEAGVFDPASPWFILPMTVLPMVVAFLLGEMLLPAPRRADGTAGDVPFYWTFAMRDYVAWLTGFVLLVVLALRAPWQVPSALDVPVDLSLPLVTPPGIHPEWYFMFAFEVLRIIPGEFAVMLFAAAAAAWLLVPFLDRPARAGRRNPRALRAGVLIIVVLLGLTWLGYRAADEEVRAAPPSARVR